MNELSRLSITSKALRNAVIDYTRSTASRPFRELFPSSHSLVPLPSDARSAHSQNARPLHMQEIRILHPHDARAHSSSSSSSELVPDSRASLALRGARLGLLLKRATIFMCTRERLARLAALLVSHLCDCGQPQMCAKLFAFGYCVHAMLRGWDDRECLRAYLLLTETVFGTEARLILDAVTSGNPGNILLLSLL